MMKSGRISRLIVEFYDRVPGRRMAKKLAVFLRRNANTALGGDRLDLHNVPKFSEAFNQALFLLVG
jgi:hypothetical protein